MCQAYSSRRWVGRLLRSTLFFVGGTVAMLCVFPSHAADMSNPLYHVISPFPGSRLEKHAYSEYDQYSIPLGPVGKGGHFTRAKRTQGQVAYLRYDIPVRYSPLQVLDSYKQALMRQGFRILWQCNAATCTLPGSDNSAGAWKGAPTTFSSGNTNYWADSPSKLVSMTAAYEAPGKPAVYVHLVISHFQAGREYMESYILQPGALPDKNLLVDTQVLDATRLAQQMVQSGKAVLYLHFDFNQARIHAADMPALQQVALLMQRYPALRVQIKGYTDTVGSAAANQRLSLERAAAVRDTLIQLQVAPGRMTVNSYGALDPVASNATETGRASNRRVEIVDLTPGVIPASAANGAVPPASNPQTPPARDGRPAPAPVQPSAADRAVQDMARSTSGSARAAVQSNIDESVRKAINGLFGN